MEGVVNRLKKKSTGYGSGISASYARISLQARAIKGSISCGRMYLAAT